MAVTKSGGQKIPIPVQIDRVAPGLFSADSSGKGAAAAVAVHVDPQGNQTSQMTFQCKAGGGCSTAPLDAGTAADPLILLLYGTGIRGYATGITATIGGQKADVIGAAAQGQYMALDQVNVRVPPALAGKGEVPVVLTVDGRRTNAVKVNIR